MGKTLVAFAGWLALAAWGIQASELGPSRANDGPGVEVSFHFQEMKVMASNQFAIWVEDSRGNLVRTIFATDFTGRGGGWDFRENSLPVWVERAEVSSLPDERFDAFSGATPSSGNLIYEWDLLDDGGKPVPPDSYTVFLEATLRDKDQVIYKAAVKVGGAAETINPEPSYKGADVKVRAMIDKVTVRYNP